MIINQCPSAAFLGSRARRQPARRCPPFLHLRGRKTNKLGKALSKTLRGSGEPRRLGGARAPRGPAAGSAGGSPHPSPARFAFPPNARFKIRNITENIISLCWCISRNHSPPFINNFYFLARKYSSVSSARLRPAKSIHPFPQKGNGTVKYAANSSFPRGSCALKATKNTFFPRKNCKPPHGGPGWGAGHPLSAHGSSSLLPRAARRPGKRWKQEANAAGKEGGACAAAQSPAGKATRITRGAYSPRTTGEPSRGALSAAKSHLKVLSPPRITVLSIGSVRRLRSCSWAINHQA